MDREWFTRVRVSADGCPDGEAAGWADGLEIALPRNAAECLAPFLVDASTLQLPTSPFLLPLAEAESLRLAAALTERAPVSARLPISYQRVPMSVRTVVGRLAGRIRRLSAERWARFPAWPLDLSADVLSDLAGAGSSFAHGPTPVLLTHDLDSAEGLQQLVSRFLPIEEAAAARSANFIVPCAWTLDDGLLRAIVERGHELGVHGYDHSNCTAYVASAERDARLDAAVRRLSAYDVAGYRSPSLVRTRSLFDGLAARFRYDTSIPTSGGPFPVPNNGCASARPFRIFGVLEIPLTLPRDGSLRFLGHSPEQVLGLWRRCTELIARSGGVVSLLTHCESRFSGSPEMLDVYERFVGWVADDPRFAFHTPRDLVGGLQSA